MAHGGVGVVVTVVRTEGVTDPQVLMVLDVSGACAGGWLAASERPFFGPLMPCAHLSPPFPPTPLTRLPQAGGIDLRHAGQLL